MMPARTGHVRYTARAFEQDAGEAMRGDVVRALIELITNADDAYGDEAGEITIEVDDGPEGTTRIAVRDHARGLTAAELEDCFVTLGARSSGFEEGRAVRGNLGRGAKDTAVFGRTVFEAVRDEHYSRLVLTKDGTWTLEATDEPVDEPRRSAMRLAPQQNGLSATVLVERQHKVPRFDRLVERLSRTAQLRLLTRDRETVLIDRRGRSQAVRPVRYDAPPASPLLDQEHAVEGYEAATARIVVERLATRVESPVGDESDHGLLVVGRHAVYENTLFELGNKLHAGWFRGRLECPFIDELIRDYDDRAEQGQPHTDDNPVRIVSRDRDGLVREHPFTKALSRLVAFVVGPLIDQAEREQTAGQREGESLRRALRDLSDDLARQLRRDLDELEEDDRGSGGAPTEVAPIAVVPPRLVLQPGRDKTLTVLVRDDIASEGSVVRARCDAPDVVAVIDDDTPVARHRRLASVLVTQVRIKAAAEGTGRVIVGIAGHEAVCAVTISDEEPVAESAPEDLVFARPTASVQRGKKRTIELWAPVHLFTDEQPSAAVEVDGTNVVLGAPRVDLAFDGRRGWFVGRVPVEGAATGTSTLTARAAGRSAQCRVRVADPADPTSLGVEITVTNDRSTTARAVAEEAPEGILLKVFGRHPAIDHLLGRHTDEGFEHEQDPKVRLVLAEIIADTLVEWLLEREAGRYPERFPDTASVLAQRRSRLRHYLPRTQRLLLGG